jgi:hypothetical protein
MTGDEADLKQSRNSPLLPSWLTAATWGPSVGRLKQMKILGLGGAILSLALTGAIFAAGPADATASAGVQRPTSGRYCAAVLAPVQAGARESAVTYENCYSSEKERASAPALRDTTLLMTWYTDRDYFGGSTQWRGSAGGCDSAGYGKAVVPWEWATTISSFKVWSGCYHTTAYTNENFGGASRIYSGNVPYVGDFMNDIIHSMWVRS